VNAGSVTGYGSGPHRRAPDRGRLTNGGASGATEDDPGVVSADDLEVAERRVAEAGGKIVRPTYSFPGGRRFHFTDPAGNELAVWSDKEAPS